MESMQKKVANLNDLDGILLPFLYNNMLVVKLSFNNEKGLLGYADGAIQFIHEDEIDFESEKNFFILETPEEMQAAIDLCKNISQKISYNSEIIVLNTNIIATQFSSEWDELLDAFRQFEISLIKTNAYLL